jgi:hypothetical protein
MYTSWVKYKVHEYYRIWYISRLSVNMRISILRSHKSLQEFYISLPKQSWAMINNVQIALAENN